ncbi:MAG: hypothetical protein JWQ33_3126, partial [Ramlibacter sp.]|nr:hypothetical protein [Ramlibacter sp.]
AGNVVVTGWTRSGDFPTVAASDNTISGGQDAVVFKLNAAGSALVYSTYFGGTGATDAGNAVAVDAAGNAYVAGQGSDSGLLSPLLALVFGTSDNAFVNKYASNGTLGYSKLLGGSANDLATGVAVGNAGDVYIVGNTQSTNMSVVGAEKTTLGGAIDGFLTHLDASGSTVLYSTYVGAGDADTLTGVAVDGTGKAYVVGETRARNNIAFTVTANAWRPTTTVNNADTGFLRIYDTNQTGAASLVYSSYVGGSGTDRPTGVVFTNGRIVVVGQAASTDFPVTADAAQSTNAGSSMFVAEINPAVAGVAALDYGTYYGTGMTVGGVAATSTGVYVASNTSTAGLAKAGGNSTVIAGQDALVTGFTLATVPNAAPVLSGSVNLAAVLEDSTGTGTLVSTLTNGHVTDSNAGALAGIAVTAVNSANGAWQFSLNGGGTWTVIPVPSATAALLLAADTQTRIRFVPAANFAGTVTGGLTFRAWDRTSGTAGSTADASVNGGMTAFSVATASADVAVTAINDAPVRTSGVVANLTLAEDAPITSLGLGTLNYGKGGGADEASQVLTYSVTALPGAALGNVVLADGTTLAAAGTAYSLTDLQGMKFIAAANANGGPATFSWKVTDDGGTANGGVDTLVESLTISLTAVNDAPVRTAGAISNVTLAEDAGATSLGLGALAYGPGGGADEATQSLTVTVTALPAASLGHVVLANGNSTVTTGGSYTVAELQGMKFKPGPDANGGPATFSWTVADSGGTANGGVDALAGSLTITVTAVNDAPVRTGGTVSDLMTTDSSPTTSLNLAGLSYGSGGRSDEASQTLTYKVTVVPGASIGQVVLADGVTAVTANTSYTLAQLQGMEFSPAPGSGGGTGSFAWTVQDNGGVAGGGVDTLAESLQIGVTAGPNAAPVLSGANAMSPVLEDSPGDAGTLVSSLVAGRVTDTNSGALAGIAVTGVNAASGSWQYSLNGGASWSAISAPSPTSALLLAADAQTSIRFVPVADFTGTVTGGLTFRAWDRTSGSAGGVADTSTNGGTTAFSAATASAAVTVIAVNDAPVRTAGAVNNLMVAEDAPATSLGLGALGYGNGGGSDEAAQVLTYTVTAVPNGALGNVVLADGTTVVTANATYTLADLQGMQFKTAANANGGPTTFGWKVTDSGGSANGGVDTLAESLAIGITAVDDAPVANNDTLTATEDTAATYTAAQLLGNDTDVDGPSLTIGTVTSGAGGTAVLNGNGTVTFSPGADFNGVAGFSYTATDGALASNTATVTVNVAPVNDAPVAVGDILAATEDTPVTYTAAQLLANDTDVDGPALTIAGVTSGSGGTAVLNGNGTVTFTPGPNFSGAAGFSYAATDGALTSNAATVTVNVAAANHAPVAVNDSVAASEDTPVTYTAAQLLGNDVDQDGQPLSIASVASASGGTAVLNPDGTVTFTPAADYSGPANFDYVATDSLLTSNAASVTVTIAAVNDAPVAASDTLAATEDTPVTYTAAQLLGNDTDVDGPALTVASVTSGIGGSAVLKGVGTVTFVPIANFNGAAVFSYTATD